MKKQSIHYVLIFSIITLAIIALALIRVYTPTGNATLTPSCTDTDGGIKRITFGTVTGTDTNGQTYSYQDRCIDTSTLLEYSCNNNAPTSQNIICNVGQSVCQNGACINITLAQPTCGDSICQNGETCEWNGGLNRQMLCDGLQGAIPSGGSCHNCAYTAPSSVPTCGNGICETGESCEWNGAQNRQMLCDGSQGAIPSGGSCHSCGYTAPPQAPPIPQCGNTILETGEECETGQTSSTSCGNTLGICTTGTKTRTCTTSCTWGQYGQCSGVQPTAELCDGLDNDCDGQTDEGNICPTENSCGDGSCASDESTSNCPIDCPSQQTNTCGNFVCEATETTSTCPQDCTTQNSYCGNYICENDESSATCPTDCTSSIVSSSCGNFICDYDETTETCPTDCAPTQYYTNPTTCGNFICETVETSSTCPTDCGSTTQEVCGNTICELTETQQSCPQDCTTPLSTSCGDGICDQGESCEWNAAETRQILCDGTKGAIPSGSACVRCVYVPPRTLTCGDAICSEGETSSCPQDCARVVQLEKRQEWCRFLKLITIGIIEFDKCVAKDFK